MIGESSDNSIIFGISTYSPFSFIYIPLCFKKNSESDSKSVTFPSLPEEYEETSDFEF